MKKHIQRVTKSAKRPFTYMKGAIQKRRSPEEEEMSVIPRITNETLAQHREEVLGGARKFIYPLAHSKHKVVLISSFIGFLTATFFLVYTSLALYKFNDYSDFLYRITKVVPFPVARVKGHFVSYESYYFELNHYIHYYEVQQKTDFSTPGGQQQLKDAKSQLLQQVIDKTYIKLIADEKGIRVTDKEVDDQITLLRDNSRLGGSNRVYLDVLRNWYNWSEADFKRKIKDQLLSQKLTALLDTETKSRAEKAIVELNAGKDFGEVASTYSDDALTKAQKGDMGTIDRSNRDVPAILTDALYKLAPSSYSSPIDIGYGLEIIKNIEVKDGKIHAAHILFQYKDISTLINDYKENNKARKFISV